jgi:hypothetical protein
MNMPTDNYAPEHVAHVLRAARAGKSVREINTTLPFSFPGCFNVAFTLRRDGYILERTVGTRPIKPYVAHGNFTVDSEPIVQGSLSKKGAALLRKVEAGQ